MKDKYQKIEYMCTYCGAREIKPVWAGRPLPGTCKARTNCINGKKWPHRWVVNKRF